MHSTSINMLSWRCYTLNLFPYTTVYYLIICIAWINDESGVFLAWFENSMWVMFDLSDTTIPVFTHTTPCIVLILLSCKHLPSRYRYVVQNRLPGRCIWQSAFHGVCVILVYFTRATYLRTQNGVPRTLRTLLCSRLVTFGVVVILIRH